MILESKHYFYYQILVLNALIILLSFVVGLPKKKSAVELIELIRRELERK